MNPSTPPPSRSSSSLTRRRRSYTVSIKIFLVLPLLLLWLLNHRIISSAGSSFSSSSSSSSSIISSLHRADASSHHLPSDRHPPGKTEQAGDNDPPPAAPPVVIAYAISLIKCSDKQSSTSGLLDAATILRHSIHRTSIRNPSSGSKYDYKLYAIVHSRLASHCSRPLTDLGYEVLLRDAPVEISEIRGEYLRKNVHKEWCCGADEFVKLYAYMITSHPIVVHTDIDFMYHAPMDDLYDAMLLSSESGGGRLARSRIELEYPNAAHDMPANIEAYLTRDYHQVIPGRKAGALNNNTVLLVPYFWMCYLTYDSRSIVLSFHSFIPTWPAPAAFQAGFLVLKPDVRVFEQYLEVIREGNYVEGFSRENGWGGMGYGGVVGSMAMQGLPAYFYDVIRPNTTVELNGCRYNHMGANVYYDDVPNFISKYRDLHGKCRRGVEGCEDCRRTDLSSIRNIHFTNCRKPWNCAGKSSTGKGDIDPRTADYDHCMQGKILRFYPDMGTEGEGGGRT